MVTLLLQEDTIAPAPLPPPPSSEDGVHYCGEVMTPEWQRHCLEHGLQADGSLPLGYAASQGVRPLAVDDIQWPEDAQVGLCLIDTE